MLWRQASAAVLVSAGALWLVGCGGAAGPTWSSSGPSYGSSGSMGAAGSSAGRSAPQPAGVVTGVVEMPARPAGYGRPIAWRSWLRIGSAAHAEAQIARAPLVGAQVSLIDRGTGEPVSSTVNTNTKGEFRIEHVTPSGRFSIRATDGKSILEAVVPAMDGARHEVRVTVNELTTVGAAAARLAEAEGLGPEACIAVATQVAELQQALQSEKPAEVPDLTRADEARDRARQHILRTADAAISGALEGDDRGGAWRALASAQLLARASLKLPSKLALTSAQVDALTAAMVSKDARTVTAEKVVAALRKAGVKGKEGKAVAAGDVSQALDGLRKPLPCLKETKAEKLPVLAALLLVEQSEAPFQVSTREQMKAYLKELVGEAPAPGKKAKPAAATAAKPGAGRPAAGAEKPGEAAASAAPAKPE